MVLEKVFGINSTLSYFNNDIKVDDVQLQKTEEYKNRLLKHEPVQYILNEAWFYDIPFFVDKNVLIPRPETEELVHWIITDHKNKDVAFSILDIGTGSGCIPIILKRKLPDAVVYSCDISETALVVAKKNASKFDTKIHFFQLNILNEDESNALPQVDIMISNPPYIPVTESSTIANNVLQYEPGIALFVSDSDPLIFYSAIATLADKILKPSGQIYVETHEALANKVASLFEQHHFHTQIKKDLQGKNRMVKAWK
jgi:release factor glutamine methyltransferase